MKARCYDCVYKGKVPGSAHIRCCYDWQKSGKPLPQGEQHGIEQNWYIFPFRFDPLWMKEECPSFATVRDPEMTKEAYDPLTELMAIFRSVGR